MNLKTRFLSLPLTWRRRLGWAIAFLFTYTVVGFLILPPIVKAVAVKRVSALLDRQVTIQKVRINPYAFSGSIRGLLIKDKDGEPFLSWDEAYANFQLKSFLMKPWVFAEVRLSQPFVRAQVNRDRSLNFSDLLEKFAQPGPAPAKPAKPVYLRVDRLNIIGASASFSDLSLRTPFHRVLGPLEISLTGFHTDPSNRNPYSFSGTTDAGEKFAWSGVFFLDPLHSEGELSLSGLSLPKYAPLYQDLSGFEIKQGVVSLRAEYRVGISASNYIAAVSNAMFSLSSLKIAKQGSAENVAELDQLAVHGANVDAMNRTATINSLAVDGARIAVKRDAEEKLNLVEMAQPAVASNAVPGGGIILMLRAATNAFAYLLRSTNQASVLLHHLDVTNCAVVWDDLATTRPVHFPVDEIAVTARELSNQPGSNMTAAVSLRWNTNGTIRVDSVARVSPLEADVNLALKDLELGPLDPYLKQFLNLLITGSKLALDGQIRLRSQTNDLPDISFKGDARLDDFLTVDGMMTEDLVRWKSVRVTGIDSTLVPPAVSVREIMLEELQATVTVETNHALNVFTALKLGETNAPAAEPPPVQTPAAASGKQSFQQRFGGMLRQALGSKTNTAGQPMAPRFAVDTIVISNAALQFQDRSFQPTVSLSVDDLSGTITGLASEDLKRADLQLTGKVGKAGPVEITGKLYPLTQKTPTEVKVIVRDVELTPTSPYVGKYAGYRLNRGKLGLEMNYEISERKLVAKNLLVLDQFTFGDKVDSPDATKLPVRLAVMLLKDRSGKIELDVPIEGTLDDPDFRLGKVILRTLVNVITKIVTSPFAALSAIFGGKGEELSFQDFAPGKTELRPDGVEKLADLAKGLYERPGLMLEIEGNVDPIADRDALARQKLENEFRLAKWSAMRKSRQAQVKPEEIELDPGEFEDFLKVTYENTFSPEAVAARTNNPARATNAPALILTQKTKPTEVPKGAQLLMVKTDQRPALPLAEWQHQLFQSVEISDDDFKKLAQSRAEQVRQNLIEAGKVESERISFTENPTGAVATKGSRAYVSFK